MGNPFHNGQQKLESHIANHQNYFPKFFSFIFTEDLELALQHLKIIFHVAKSELCLQPMRIIKVHFRYSGCTAAIIRGFVHYILSLPWPTGLRLTAGFQGGRADGYDLHGRIHGKKSKPTSE